MSITTEDADAAGRAVEAAVDPAVEVRLLQAAQNARTSRQRLIWLQRAADLVLDAAQRTLDLPCSSGCSFCCYLPLPITEIEARALADHSGRRLLRPPASAITVRKGIEDPVLADKAQAEALAAFTGQPCPFLSDGRCGVYAMRPLACRQHITLERTSDPCRLDRDGGSTGQTATRLQVLDRSVVQLMTLGLEQHVADVRDWFPAKDSLTS